jgi:hypothetical protein
LQTSEPRTLVDKIYSHPVFQGLMEQGQLKMAQIKPHFPDVGETAIKEARRRWLARAESPAPVSAALAQETEDRDYKDSGNTLQYKAVTQKQITTPEELLAHIQLDEALWEVREWSCRAYQSVAIPRPTGSSSTGWERADGEPRILQLFSVSAKLVKRQHVERMRDEIQAIIAELQDHAPAYPTVWVSPPAAGLLGEFSIPDVHLGKLAWAQECGADYDVRIAEEIYREAVLDLIDRCGGQNYQEMLYLVGSDFLNSDDIENRTTRGTPQSTDGRHFRTFVRAHQLAAWTIEQLSGLAPVRVAVVPGNHDFQNTFYLGEVLRYRFDQHPHVEVNNAPTTRKYHEFGDVMLLLTHGDKEKHATLGTLMASEQPQMWGRTSFREAHIGHLHKVWLDEQFGVRIRMMPSLCAAEDWHSASGYIGNVRAAQAIIWDKEQGMTAHHFYNVPKKYLSPSGR